MKIDRYTKIILTIIAICLVWICVRDVKIGGNYLFADSNGRSRETEVYITGGEIDIIRSFRANAFSRCEPIQVLDISSHQTQELDTNKK